ncbi:MAG TPA: hypothetical protein VMS01_18465 [Stellaceae bacterium]|nr:hypothetical protein [Stellaceae bacterium]
MDFLFVEDFVDFGLVAFFRVDFLVLLCAVDFVGAAVGLVGLVGATAGAFAAGAGAAAPEGA